MSSSICRVCGAMGMFLVLVAGTLPCGSDANAADLAVYGDALGSGWVNWSWDTTVNLGNPSPVHQGHRLDRRDVHQRLGRPLSATPTPPLSGGDYQSLRFHIHGGSSGGQHLQVVLYDGSGALPAPPSPSPRPGRRLDAGHRSPGRPRQPGADRRHRLAGHQRRRAADVLPRRRRSSPGIVPPPPPPPEPDPRCDRRRHRAARHQPRHLRHELRRRDARRRAAPAGAALGRQLHHALQLARRHQQHRQRLVLREHPQEDTTTSPPCPTATASTASSSRTGAPAPGRSSPCPLIGWTPKRAAAGHPYRLRLQGLQVRRAAVHRPVGPRLRQRHARRRHADHRQRPADTIDGDRPRRSSRLGSTTSSARYGTAAHGGVAYYNLDNEPMLWSNTHRDVHPEPTSYDEMRDRTYPYAAAVKAADPTAKTLGPVVWGWTAYFWSALTDGGR